MKLVEIEQHLKPMSKFNIQVLTVYAILEIAKAVYEVAKELRKMNRS